MSPALPAEPPLPPERGVEVPESATAAPAPPNVVSAPVEPAGPPAPDCIAALVGSGIVVEAAAQPSPANPACHIDQPVKLLSMVDGSDGGRSVSFPAAPVIACKLVRPLGAWLSGVALPVLRVAHGAPVRAVETGPGSECRSRDRIPGERLSAHAIGLALDIAGFSFTDGKALAIKPDEAAPPSDRAALAAVRTAACGWFTTILGPGSDPYHTDHLHLDIQQHGTTDRYRICQ